MKSDELIDLLYYSLKQRDWKGIMSCYHPKARFTSNQFPALSGPFLSQFWNERLNIKLIKFSVEMPVNGIIDISSIHAAEALFTFTFLQENGHHVFSTFNSFMIEDGLIIQHKEELEFITAFKPIYGWSIRFLQGYALN